jgi:hypothetical protein
MRKLIALGFVLVTACGEPVITDDDGTPSVDAAILIDAPAPIAAPDALPPIDAPIDTPVPTGWGVPVRIPAISDGASDVHPSVTADRLELYFASNRPGGAGGWDVWISTRDSADEPWAIPVPLNTVNTTQTDTSPEVTADGLALRLSSNRDPMVGGRDVWMSTRATRLSPWSQPVRENTVNSAGLDSGASVDPSGLTLVMHSDSPAGQNDLFMATRGNVFATWSPRVAIAALNTVDSESQPLLVAGGTKLYFTRGGTRDLLYVATRPSSDGVFGEPVPHELNVEVFSQGSAWVSQDEQYMVFHSNREGDNEIYEVVRE